MAQKRTKEIGIRKVLGATVIQITAMLCREFLVLVAIALLVASPVGAYLMHRWLQGYVYRVGISWWTFTIAGIAALLIALLTVIIQSIKAGRENPVKSLRNA
jgi:putative ABC transport system permease protein